MPASCSRLRHRSTAAERPGPLLAEAKLRSGTDLVRKLLPIHIDPSLNDLETSLADAFCLQKSLFQEETTPHNAAMKAISEDYVTGDESFLRKVHASGVYVQQISDLTQTALMPALAAARAARFAADARRNDMLTQLQQVRAREL